MNRLWTKFVGQHLTLLLVGTLIGYFYGQAVLGALIVIVGILGWHGFFLFRLERWLRTG